ncbi:MAG TPA: hypothetical protein VET85_03085 [Stellaceae bacterium]|nr:hypothetical protein [Stellaceae bacterium]
MTVIAIIGVLAFLIGLVVRAPQRQHAAGSGGGQPAPSPQWYELTLAVLLLAVIAAFAIWLVSNGKEWAWGDAVGDWQADTRTIVFAAVMVALGVIGLVASFAYALVQSARPPLARETRASRAEAAPAPAAVPAAAMPSGLRLLGLLALALALLLLCWIALPAAQQWGLIVQLIYPAALGVALVLLFDKATRAWGVKGGAESFREWLFCDLLIFLLVLGFLNLRSVAKPEAYASAFWDILNIALFFTAFWVLDRTGARSRFLLGYAYLVVAALLLLIWGAVQGVAAAAFWASLWPFLILAAVFFVLEIVTLVASSGERQTLPAVKDAVFAVLYAILLIVAVSAGAHA